MLSVRWADLDRSVLADRNGTLLVASADDATFEELPGLSGDCPSGATLCASPAGHSSSSYGYRCISPIAPSECPADTDLTRCNQAKPGQLCDGDGECGTLESLNNCRGRGNHDVYRASTPIRSHVLLLTALWMACPLSPSAQHGDVMTVGFGREP